MAADVPVATAFTAADIFADPHIAARGDLVTVDDPVAGPLRQQAPYPRRVGEAPEPRPAPRARRSTPTRSSRALGLDAAELARLSDAGII